MVERTIEAEDPETVAAVIMEPMSISSAGFVVPPPEYFSILRAACDKHNVLLIFDEIITGFGRLGAWFGADYYGVAPDLLACGKGMSGGYAPLASVLIADRVWQAFLGDPDSRREFHHGHTFAGNPVACAAGLATLAEYQEHDLIAHAAQLGGQLRTRLDGFRGSLSVRPRRAWRRPLAGLRLRCRHVAGSNHAAGQTVRGAGPRAWIDCALWQRLRWLRAAIGHADGRA